MHIASINVDNLYSYLEKKKGKYIRHTHWDGKKPIIEEVSELKAAEICSYSDWRVITQLHAAKQERFAYQEILKVLMDL